MATKRDECRERMFQARCAVLDLAEMIADRWDARKDLPHGTMQQLRQAVDMYCKALEELENHGGPSRWA